MARSVPIQMPQAQADEPVPEGYAPAYYIMVPGLAYKAISDAAAKKNMTVAEVVSRALTEYLKKTGD